MSKNDKKVFTWGTIFVIVVLVIWVLSKTAELESSKVSNATPTSGAKTGVSKSTPITSTKNTLTYEQVIAQYADRRIQIDNTCQAIPAQMAIKTGTKMLFDNRSNNKVTLRLDGDTIVLPAYGWALKIISPSKSLPYSLGVDCESAGGSRNNGLMLNVQANILKGVQ